MNSITVALPAYNEADNIEAMVENVIQVMNDLTKDYEVIIVDDGSRDRTAEVVTMLERRHPQVSLVRHDANQGYGAAVFSGLTRASKELVFLTDSDRQFDLREIDKLMDPSIWPLGRRRL